MILELKDIKLSFTGNSNETLNLLKGVNFGIERGIITALIGGNGSGKTTLFNIISGFENGYSGQVWFNGKNISGLQPYKVSKQGIGRLFQSKQLIGDLSLIDNMKLASDDRTGELPFEQLLFPKRVAAAEKRKEERAIEILKNLFGEENKYMNMLNEKTNSLSYGEQRLIALARLMMSKDKLLLLDEPSAGVNPHYFDVIAKVIRRMVEISGVTVLVIEHNLNFIRNFADQVIYLDDGIIQMTGTTEEVLNNANLINRYIGL
jgi:branched-chain amino acid transport system ATP-binding protein